MKPWQQLLNDHAPLILPACHDPLTARLAARAGYPAIQVGMFALAGSRLALPDLGLVQAGEAADWVRDIIRACGLPALVDCDNGHGEDLANVCRTMQLMEAAGACALFLEDQAEPKRCGHLPGKKVVPVEAMTRKLRAARLCLQDATFLLARTDAYESEGLPGCRERAEAYLDAGADGLYFEGVDDPTDLAALGREFRAHPLALSVLEGNGHTPWQTPWKYHSLGFSMILYPTTLLFRSVTALCRGLADLRNGTPTPPSEGYTLEEWESVVDLAAWDALNHL